jgi:hypothetical protein
MTLRAGTGLPVMAATIGNIRIAGLALAPQMAGFLLKFGFALWGRNERCKRARR